MASLGSGRGSGGGAVVAAPARKCFLYLVDRPMSSGAATPQGRTKKQRYCSEKKNQLLVGSYLARVGEISHLKETNKT